jgi:hypothetical protein
MEDDSLSIQALFERKAGVNDSYFWHDNCKFIIKSIKPSGIGG